VPETLVSAPPDPATPLRQVAVPAGVCGDCGAAAPGNYCSACGQETHIETPTVRQFVHELLDQYVAVEGKLGRTLRVLLLQPGQLTRDYLEGRRQRYVRPLKLYLSVSVVFFSLFGLLPDYSGAPIVKLDPGEAKQVLAELHKEHADAAADRKTPAKAPAVAKDGDNGDEAQDQALDQAIAQHVGGAGTKWSDRLTERAKGFGALAPAEQQRLLRTKLADDAPYAMFLLVPYLALLLKWLYRKNHLLYGAHLLFSLHLHCFAFIVLAVRLLPLPSVLGTALNWLVAGYVFLALRCVYGSGWKRTAWREALLFVLYGLVLGLTAVSGVLGTVFGHAA
jgi:hypothetical protein